MSTLHSVPSSCTQCQPVLIVSTSDKKYRLGVPFKVLTEQVGPYIGTTHRHTHTHSHVHKLQYADGGMHTPPLTSSTVRCNPNGSIQVVPNRPFHSNNSLSSVDGVFRDRKRLEFFSQFSYCAFPCLEVENILLFLEAVKYNSTSLTQCKSVKFE